MDGYTHVYSFSRPFDHVKKLLYSGSLHYQRSITLLYYAARTAKFSNDHKLFLTEKKIDAEKYLHSTQKQYIYMYMYIRKVLV